MKPNRTFTSVPADNREWTRFLSGLFFANQWETTLLGCTTEPVGTARYTVSAGVVTLQLPALSATSNAAQAFLTDLPSAITPEHGQYCLAGITDNGVTAIGMVHIGTDTGITLYKGLSLGAFTAAGTKGLVATTIIYSLD